MSNSVASFAEQGLLPLKDLLIDDGVNEVVINPDGRIFVEHSNQPHMVELTGVELSDHEIHSLGSNLAGETNHALGEEHPIVSGRVFVFGSDVRVQVVVPPAIENGVSLSIRKYIANVLESSEIRLLEGSDIDLDQERLKVRETLAELIERDDIEAVLSSAIAERMNILVAGGTSSGKTTIARALLNMCHADERMITIEDAVELRPLHRNRVALVASRRDRSTRSTGRLLESALRMRPDRLIVGELRGREAFDFLEAINTGHPGSISTIHADSPKLAFERLALMVLQTGVQLSRRDVLEYAARSIDLVVQVGRRNGERGVLSLYLPKVTQSGLYPEHP